MEIYFNSSKSYKIVASFQRSADILYYLKRHKVDIIITEILTHEELGTELISMIRKKAPKSWIIVYSSIAHNTIKEKCIKAGADLFICKTQNLPFLKNAITEIINLNKNESNLASELKLKNYSLTSKERIIIEYMINGMSSPEIAKKLSLSPNTINNQKNHMIKKFNCNTSIELVAKLFRQGYLKI